MEFVESNVEELEGRERENYRGELAGEVIVAEIELKEESEETEGVGDGAAEAIGIDVEQGKVGQEAEIVGQGSRDVGVVEVNPGNGEDVGVVGSRGTEDAGVVADVGTVPVGSEVGRVVGDGVFPTLESCVGLEESLVGEKWGWRRWRRRWRRRCLKGRFGEEDENREEEEE